MYHVCCQQIHSKKGAEFYYWISVGDWSHTGMRHRLGPKCRAQSYTTARGCTFLLRLAQMWTLHSHVPPWAGPPIVRSYVQRSSQSYRVCSSTHRLKLDFDVICQLQGPSDSRAEDAHCCLSLVCYVGLHAVVFLWIYWYISYNTFLLEFSWLKKIMVRNNLLVISVAKLNKGVFGKSNKLAYSLLD
jgi:hypothetical protein